MGARKFNGKTYQLMDERVSKESAKILANRFRRNGASVRIIKHKPSKSYNVYARGEGKFWM